MGSQEIYINSTSYFFNTNMMCTKKLMGSTESPSTIVDPPALISFKNICSCCMLVKIQKLLFDHLLQSSVVLFFYKKNLNE